MRKSQLPFQTLASRRNYDHFLPPFPLLFIYTANYNIWYDLLLRTSVFFLLFKFRVWCVYCALSCQIHTAPWLYPISVRSLFICICLRVRTFSFRVYGRIFQEAPSQILFPSSVSGHAFIRAFVILSSSLF